MRIGDVIIIQEYDPKKLLRKIWRRFEDLSDEDKAEVALEAKKWAQEK